MIPTCAKLTVNNILHSEKENHTPTLQPQEIKMNVAWKGLVAQHEVYV